jgi:hypothetical protein
MGVIVSVNVGLPQDVAWQGRTVRTAVWKAPVTGRIVARRLNLDGDGQGDLRGHGGEQRLHRALPVQAECRNSHSAAQGFERMLRGVEKGIDLGNRHTLGAVCELLDAIAGANLTFL